MTKTRNARPLQAPTMSSRDVCKTDGTITTPEKITVPEYVIRDLHQEEHPQVPYESFCEIYRKYGVCIVAEEAL
ncbi:MAG: hypothetical protein JXA44_04080 [Methanospirillaceae archaeon]|nr:hypothetical protein [Methanospirillaceae archaeon]